MSFIIKHKSMGLFSHFEKQESSLLKPIPVFTDDDGVIRADGIYAFADKDAVKQVISMLKMVGHGDYPDYEILEIPIVVEHKSVSKRINAYDLAKCGMLKHAGGGLIDTIPMVSKAIH